jgi:hypothetical protein
MTLLPEIHDALARAVATRPVRRRWWHPSRRTGLLAVGALVATGSAVAATTGWQPILGDDHRGHPQAAHASVPTDQIAALGVLRRAQNEGDRSAGVEAILRYLSRHEINGVHTDAIRVLRRRADGLTILVPAERVGDKRIPASVHHHVLCVLTGVTITPSVTGVLGGVGQVCGDLRALRTTGIGASGSHTDHGWVTGALVPDGVARVVLRMRHHRYLAAAVRDNYYEINTGSELAPAWGVRWLDAHGHTIDHRRAKAP